jgi:hypothetical protein
MSDAMKKQNYEEHPSALHKLYDSDARQILVDYFLQVGTMWEEDDEPLSKADIVEATGLDRRSIGTHIDVLIEFGIAGVTDNEDTRWERYYPSTESDSFWALLNANNELIKSHERQKRESE